MEVIEVTEREVEIIEVIERGPQGVAGPQPDINYTVVTSARTLEAADLIAADTSGGAFTLTLPANPSNGDAVDIFDFSETFDTNNLTIARNGSKIESLTEDLVCNVEGAYFTLIYTGATRGWQVLPRYGTSGGGGESVLTTQGDTLYRAVGVNARLPIGTAGQVLKVNSGATAPEWGTISTAPSGPAGGDLAGTYPNPTLSASGVSAGTYTKVTVDTKGRVTTGATATPTDIGAAAASHTHAASDITSGTVAVARLPIFTYGAGGQGLVPLSIGGQAGQFLKGDGNWTVVTSSDVGLGNVNNTSDANKPVSTATQTALDLKAPLDSPALTGTPTAPTASAGTNTTQIATTAFTLANRGDRYLTTSTDSHSLTTGSKTFTVQSGLSYTATQDITIVADADPVNKHMHGVVTSYSGTTLVVDIQTVNQSGGPYTAWTINVGGLLSSEGALYSANNLSDVANTATALTNLGGVPTSRTISSGNGLTGGGDLTANRTLSVSYGSSNPAALGTASAGSSNDVSRADHTHSAEVSDSAFRVTGSTDATKKVALEVDTNVPSGQTVTLTAPNANGTIARTEDFAAPPAIGSATRNTAAFTTLSANNGTLTASAPVLDLSQTWNNAAVTFTTLKINVTNTASASTSLLADMQVGGSTMFNVTRAGGLAAAAAFAVNGVSGNAGMWNGGALGWTSSGTATGAIALDTTLFRDGAANTIAQRNGTNAQTFRLYNTFTDANNHERGFLRWSSNVLQIGTEKAGTGSARALQFQTDGTTRFTFSSGGSLFIGDGSAQANNFFGWSGNGGFRAQQTSTGVITLLNWAETDFNRLQFGGTTSSFPALKRSSTALQVRLADDSADAPLSASTGTFSGSVSCVGLSSIGGAISTNSSVTLSSNATMSAQALSATLDLTSNAAGLRLYGLGNTGGSSTNTERLHIATRSGNSYFISTQATGTGTARALEFRTNDVARLTIESAGGLTVADANNIALGTTTGTKIGTATTQKIGFFNATPVVQQAAIADATDAATTQARLNDLLAAMRSLGLIAT